MGHPKRNTGDDVTQSLKALDERAEVPNYFTVSTRRMVILGIITLGGYAIYWSYKNWKAVIAQLSAKQNKKARIHPVLSSIFYPFTSYELFARVRNSQKAISIDSPTIAAGNYAWSVFLLGLVGLSFIPVAMSQKYMNGIKLKAFGDKDIRKGTSKGEVIAVIIIFLLAWGRISQTVQTNLNTTKLSSPQATQAKSEVDSLTAQYQQCSADLATQKSSVDLNSQSAVDAYNSQLQSCDNVRIQQNAAANKYNSLITAY